MQSPLENSNLSESAQQHVNEILARREAARETRKTALAAHPAPLSIKTELSRPATLTAAAVPPTVTANSTAGYLLAVGDSWFAYPVANVLTNLDDNYGYNIEPAVSNGEAIEHMVSRVGELDNFARQLDKIVALGAKPKAILISGGGDDIAGKEFGMLINNIDLGLGDWNEQIVAGVIDTRIAAAYRMMVLKLNALCTQVLGTTVPILIHGYDYPVPDGRGFLGGWGPLPGPWLKPGFDEKLFLVIPDNTQKMMALIDRFNAMLQNLLQDADFANVHYVDLRKTLPNDPADYKEYWANELHPTGAGIFDKGQDGFKAVADKFQDVLATLP
jgi:hypothetical protein